MSLNLLKDGIELLLCLALALPLSLLGVDQLLVGTRKNHLEVSRLARVPFWDNIHLVPELSLDLCPECVEIAIVASSTAVLHSDDGLDCSCGSGRLLRCITGGLL